MSSVHLHFDVSSVQAIYTCKPSEQFDDAAQVSRAPVEIVCLWRLEAILIQNIHRVCYTVHSAVNLFDFEMDKTNLPSQCLKFVLRESGSSRCYDVHQMLFPRS